MKATLIPCSLAIVVALGLAQSFASAKSASDAVFAKKAAAGGITEVELGKIAQQNGGSQDVKDFGAKMVTDHGKANDELKAIATKDALRIPDKPNAEQQAMIDKLGKETGKQFDTDYIHTMVVAHRKDKVLFTEEAANAGNPDLKKFAADTLVIVKEHLAMAEGMAAKAAPDATPQ